MRAWLEILRGRHPGTTWVPVEQVKSDAAMRRPETDSGRQAEPMYVAAA
jgi:hypothetical protein